MPLITTPGSCPAPPCQSISILLAASRPGLAVVRPDLSLPGRRAGVRKRPRPLDLAQRRREITEELRVGPPTGSVTGDQNVIGPRTPIAGQHLGSRRAQSPLCPIPNHGVADLAARSETD